MFDDALEELDSLPAEAQHHPIVVEMRLVALMQAHRWPLALAAAQELCRLRSDAPSGFIHAAFCLHELGRTAEAREMLLKGPPTIDAESNYHYNLACYECVLGNLDSAQAHLKKSFTMDAKYREYAKTDPDLRALHSARR